VTRCECETLDREFDEETAQAEVEHYQRNGPDRTTRMLIDLIIAAGVRDAELLDIGGGIGAVQHALLAAGASRAVGVEASSAYVKTARQEVERRDLDDRVSLVHGDFVMLAAETAAAEIVTLDRVVCCYGDMGALVSRSARKARRLYGLVVPRDTWWMRLAAAAYAAVGRLTRNRYRFYVHRLRSIEAILRQEGLRPLSARRTMAWHVLVYERPGATPAGR